MTPEQRLERANSARFVLENAAYTEAIEKLTQDIRTLRLQASPRDTDGLTRLVLMEQTVEKVKKLLEGYMTDGELAKRDLEKVAEPSAPRRAATRIRNKFRG